MELLIDRVIVIGEEVEIRYVIPTDPSSDRCVFVICVQTISTTHLLGKTTRPLRASSANPPSRPLALTPSPRHKHFLRSRLAWSADDLHAPSELLPRPVLAPIYSP